MENQFSFTMTTWPRGSIKSRYNKDIIQLQITSSAAENWKEQWPQTLGMQKLIKLLEHRNDNLLLADLCIFECASVLYWYVSMYWQHLKLEDFFTCSFRCTNHWNHVSLKLWKLWCSMFSHSCITWLETLPRETFFCYFIIMYVLLL